MWILLYKLFIDEFACFLSRQNQNPLLWRWRWESGPRCTTFTYTTAKMRHNMMWISSFIVSVLKAIVYFWSWGKYQMKIWSTNQCNIYFPEFVNCIHVQFFFVVNESINTEFSCLTSLDLWADRTECYSITLLPIFKKSSILDDALSELYFTLLTH